MTPAVSVGMPVYNGERYLADALDSVLAQTRGDFELVIGDNASTDGTEAICRAYASRDRRIRYVRHARNLGAARNFNDVFHRSVGRYFRWAAADDRAAPELIERCAAVLDRDPTIILAYGKTRLIDEHGTVMRDYDDGMHLMDPRPHRRLAQTLSKLGLCNVHYGLVRAEVLRRTALFGTFPHSDLCFLAELSLHGKFFEVPDHLLYRRFHPDASSSMSPQQLVAFYAPERGARRPVLRAWRELGENVRAVGRAPLDVVEKARIVRLLAQNAVWNRAQLGRELTAALGHCLVETRRQISAQLSRPC